MTVNRNIYHNFESAVSNPQIEVVDITERLRSNDFWFEVLGMSTPPAVIAFFAGVGWGRSFVELGVIVLSPNLAAITFGFSFALVVYLFVLVLHVLTTSNKYYAAKKEEEDEERGDTMITTGAGHTQARRLSGEMRGLLKRFAKYYPEFQSFGINRWERRPARIQRDALERIKSYLIVIGAAEYEGGRLKLTRWGEGRLSKWAAGDFDDLIELPENSPTPNEA